MRLVLSLVLLLAPSLAFGQTVDPFQPIIDAFLPNIRIGFGTVIGGIVAIALSLVAVTTVMVSARALIDGIFMARVEASPLGLQQDFWREQVRYGQNNYRRALREGRLNEASAWRSRLEDSQERVDVLQARLDDAELQGRYHTYWENGGDYGASMEDVNDWYERYTDDLRDKQYQAEREGALVRTHGDGWDDAFEWEGQGASGFEDEPIDAEWTSDETGLRSEEYYQREQAAERARAAGRRGRFRGRSWDVGGDGFTRRGFED